MSRWDCRLLIVLACCPIVFSCSTYGEPQGCKTDNDCDSGGACISGKCEEVECKTDSDCSNNMKCIENSCVVDPSCVSDDDCNDGNDCTSDHCKQNKCITTSLPDGHYCSDGNPCTTGDRCNSGVCFGQPNDCSALDSSCLEGICDTETGECVTTANSDGIDCNDGLYCTVGDSCQSGICIGSPRDCNDEDDCSRDECNEGGNYCDHIHEPKPGMEGPFGEESCADGEDNDCDRLTDDEDPNCIECTDDTICDDENYCTIDACVDGNCRNTPVQNGVDCTDGLYCTVGDHCESGICISLPRDCSKASDPCNYGVCVESENLCGMKPKSDGTECADGLFCTVIDRCVSGQCVSGVRRNCNDEDFCTEDRCNEEYDICENILRHNPGVEGPFGDDNCDNGLDDDCDLMTDADDPDCHSCTGDEDCNDGNDCTSDFCTQNECHHPYFPDGLYCNDGIPCTVEDQCQSGVCTGHTKDCSAFDALCVTGSCNPDNGECEPKYMDNGVECDDGYYCTISDSCQSGFCTGHNRDCDDGNTCTIDECSDNERRCEHTLNPSPGDEGPFGDATCSNGVDDDCDLITDADDPDCQN